MGKISGKLAALILTVLLTGSALIGAKAEGSEDSGVLYLSPDRTASYEFLIVKKYAKYNYNYPKAVIPGQKFAIDEADFLPNARISDCSDAEYRCVLFDKLAIAVPRDHLARDASYLVHGNSVNVVSCLRGHGAICQVALLEAQCYVRPENVCEPKGDEKLKGELWSALFFIYNEDFGVTSFGLSQAAAPKTSAEIEYDAKYYILVGDRGLLKQ